MLPTITAVATIFSAVFLLSFSKLFFVSITTSFDIVSATFLRLSKLFPCFTVSESLLIDSEITLPISLEF